ncbi:MAG: Crp/Fnr family transcriptional regulator [Sphingobacteriaceae bacterium]
MKRNPNQCDLKSCFLCQACLADWLPAIAAGRKNLSIAKGRQLFKEGDPVTGIYFVYQGSVKVHKRWDQDKELIIRFARAGDVLGHLGLGTDAFYPVSTTALEPTIVCYLDMEFFESTLKVNSGFLYKLMRFFANELQESEKRMRNLAHMTVKARIAQAMISLKNQFGLTGDGCIAIELTRQDIASFSGTSYETLFKVINEFTEQQIISMNGKQLTLLREGELLKLVAKEVLDVGQQPAVKN